MGTLTTLPAIGVVAIEIIAFGLLSRRFLLVLMTGVVLATALFT